jgi:hypothetical protein
MKSFLDLVNRHLKLMLGKIVAKHSHKIKHLLVLFLMRGKALFHDKVIDNEAMGCISITLNHKRRS